MRGDIGLVLAEPANALLTIIGLGVIAVLSLLPRQRR